MHALGTPLIVKADGTKFGKTETGTIWLDPELTTPYAFYQFWLNADDATSSNFLRIFSFRSKEEIEELERDSAERPRRALGQRALAEDLTTLVHGADQYERAVAASKALFGQGDLADLDGARWPRRWPRCRRPRYRAGSDRDLLAAAGLASRSAARRTMKEGGAYLNNAKVADEDAVPAQADLLHGRWLVLRRGKRNLAAVELQAADLFHRRRDGDYPQVA